MSPVGSYWPRKKSCTCKHAGNCPFGHTHPLAKTYPGTSDKMFRQLTEAEKAKAQLMVDGVEQHAPPLGGFISTNMKGDALLEAMAIDPERSVAHAKEQVDRRCMGDSYRWKRLHRVPKADKIITAEQCPEEVEE